MIRVLVITGRPVPRCTTPKLSPLFVPFGRRWTGLAGRAPWSRHP